MSIFQDLISRMNFEVTNKDKPVVKKTTVDILNELEGHLPYVNCPICRNKGVVYFYDDKGDEWCRKCECMRKRDMWKRLEESGLKNVINKYSFDNYIVSEEWQNNIKTKAINFTKEENGGFFIGGTVGSGKTHICTAIVKQFMRQEREALYMQWREDVVKLKQNVNDEEYTKLINPFKNVDVLYIDDLFKTQKGMSPTAADVNIAFEIINYRYNANNKITIISTERTGDELIDIDEAVGSRIIEMCGNYFISISHDVRKNYRLKGVLK